MVATDNGENGGHDLQRGIPKSGRWWKGTQQQRFSAIGKDKALRKSWSQKLKNKAEKQAIKNYEKQLNETRRLEKVEHRRRVEAHRQLKSDNQRKSEVVQVITNTAKIRRMKKKQLRQLQKRDTSGVETKKA